MRRTIIIAEVGVNHNGSMSLAKRLIDAAVDAGVDYVKFQTFNSKKLASKNASKAEYQIKNTTQKDNSQLEMLQQLELSQKEHYELIEYCNSKNIKFFSTAFDLDSIEFLSSLRLGIWKVPSGEVTNFPYLRAIGQTKEPVILSTGMCELQDINNAIDVLIRFGTNKEDITVLHCNTEYPTPFEDVNLKAMNYIASELEVKVGYSDHTIGIEVPIAAVTLGAVVIEKHFTLDRNLPGPDHKASLEPHELKEMACSIRNIEQALGSELKTISSSERKNMIVARKSIVAACPIAKGELFTEQNVTIKRPGNGISPMKWEETIGKKAIRSFEEDELIEF